MWWRPSTLHEVFRIREVRDHRTGGTVVALNPPDTGSNRDDGQARITTGPLALVLDHPRKRRQCSYLVRHEMTEEILDRSAMWHLT